MEDADRANEAMEADEGGGIAEPEQHRDDEIDSSSVEDEDEDSDEDMEDSDGPDDSDSDDEEEDEMEEEEEEEPRIPTPEEVELEYTYPQDFVGRSWEDVVQRRYYRLIIDPSCLEIPLEKFRNCKYLIEIVNPEGKDSSMLRIHGRAFAMCHNLQQMNPFPDRLVELGPSTFFNCSKLQGHITIPPCIRFVRESCFGYCGSITSVVFESSIAITIVLELEDCIFMHCEELRSVRLPNNLTVIPRDCFLGCSLLIDVPIPGTIQTIRFRAFAYCRALSAVDFPESVIAIDEEAYHSCSGLVRVTIRSSRNVVYVGNKVFRACPSLVTIRVVNPVIWSRVLSAMNYDPSFLYKFVRKYEGQIMMHHRSSR